MGNHIIWADIPVTDMARASKFYGAVLQVPVEIMPGTSDTVAIFGGGDSSGGPIVSADLYLGGTPSHDGPTIYIPGAPDIDATIARVVEAGGKILKEKAFMGDMVGWVAFFEDTEGNRIGIEQMG